MTPHHFRFVRRLFSTTGPLLAMTGCAVAPISSPSTSPSTLELNGSRWELVQIQSSDDAIGTTRIEDPSRYTIEFLDEGRFSARLDCNRAYGSWTADNVTATGGKLIFGQAAMTRALCPAGSHDTRIARDLGHIRSYTWRSGMLHMALEADGGVYTWRRR